MATLKGIFGTDKSIVEEGAWIDLYENEQGQQARIRLKRMNTQNTAFTKQLANHRGAFAKGGSHISEKKLSEMEASMIEILVNTVVVGLENVEDWRVEPSEGEFPKPTPMLEFNKENVKALLLEYPDLTELITQEAQEIKNYQNREDEAKN